MSDWSCFIISLLCLQFKNYKLSPLRLVCTKEVQSKRTFARNRTGEIQEKGNWTLRPYCRHQTKELDKLISMCIKFVTLAAQENPTYIVWKPASQSNARTVFG